MGQIFYEIEHLATISHVHYVLESVTSYETCNLYLLLSWLHANIITPH